MKALVVFVCCVAAASAHLCLLNPHQRGLLGGINSPASPDCGLMTEPCGGRDVEKPETKIKAGSSYTVIFQKNLDHYVSNSTTGYFQIGFWTGDMCKILDKINDGPTPSLTVYAQNVTMPAGPVGVPAILQVTYVTLNKEVPSGGIFYQCSDIELF